MDKNEIQELNVAWYQATLEIINRCVAPDMYTNARAMLIEAFREASKVNGDSSNE